jgi:hypothetical protein
MACDKSGPLADLEASAPSPAAPAPSSVATTGGQEPAAAPSPPARAMPPRPVPTSNPTVLITMPEDVQLQAIQYMAAMQAPQPSDAPADPTYARSIADALRPLGKTDVVSSGRRIDVLVDKGCAANLPRQAIAHYTGSSLTVLLTRGVLVIRCADHHLQCLQSTRDPDDVLCTRR